MKNTKRKGFTIVELVIVIAVIAILAAVLIPTFASMIKKAERATDLQMVTNINKALASAEVTDGKNTTMYDALKDAESIGYDLTKLVFSTENEILWNQETDRFVAADGKKIFAKDEEIDGQEKS